jgi:hypothetical protein
MISTPPCSFVAWNCPQCANPCGWGFSEACSEERRGAGTPVVVLLMQEEEGDKGQEEEAAEAEERVFSLSLFSSEASCAAA